MKTKLHHVRVNVSDLNRSIKWYEEVLGLKVTASWPPDKPNYVHFESEAGATFAIMEEKEDKVPSNGRFNFTVKNVEKLWESLKDKVDVVEELFDTPYGTTKFTIRDLDGNELGFVKE
ncbi:VOC family protein [Salinibacillus xinjiangensis]|uniref:VOC domain-containing protein n=1 Tax=Salinibacillus xinjiangensis TaxID=1229268 RepID=A0A6G1X442_9BACI|nr:VOC family protein [Salinibacillus xinjiangensis]MRG85689.1 hypothetical protein [Salinibacillus xinjiangensis]